MFVAGVWAARMATVQQSVTNPLQDCGPCGIIGSVQHCWQWHGYEWHGSLCTLGSGCISTVQRSESMKVSRLFTVVLSGFVQVRLGRATEYVLFFVLPVLYMLLTGFVQVSHYGFGQLLAFYLALAEFSHAH
jgi:hypothetical protein